MPALGIGAVAPNGTSWNWDYKRKARPPSKARGNAQKKLEKLKKEIPN